MKKKIINVLFFGSDSKVLAIFLFFMLALGGYVFFSVYQSKDNIASLGPEINGDNESGDNPSVALENENLTEVGLSQEGNSSGATTSSTKKTANNNQTSPPSANNSSVQLGADSGSSSSPAPSSTPAPESISATVAFYADSQSDSDTDDQNHQRVVSHIMNTSASTVFHAGDLLEDGTQDSLNRFNAVTSSMRASKSFYSAIGNNERNSSIYFNNFSYPNNERWYSVNVGNLHMVILDVVYSLSDQSQIAWLQSDLQSANSQNKIIGIIYHYPTYSNTINDIFESNHVDFVVAGHIHTYSHTASSDIDYFTCYGKESMGYMLMDVYSTYAKMTAFNSSNSVVETATINNR